MNCWDSCARQEDARKLDAQQASEALLDALEHLFRRWEIEHGFRPDAGKLLLPNGYDPNNPRGVV